MLAALAVCLQQHVLGPNEGVGTCAQARAGLIMMLLVAKLALA